MKNIKIYIVTYRRPEVLNKTLETLFNKTDFNSVPETEVNIISNHSEFYLDESFRGKVNVLHNTLRPDVDVGNLSRNWNQSLLNGFKDLNNPDSKIVVTMQNDIVLHERWCSNLLKMHQKYNFIVGRIGDNIISYTPGSVKRIGLWDERYCSICHKEADYFLRALILNREKSIINDVYHKRFLNETGYLPLEKMTYQGAESEWLKVKNRDSANNATKHSSQIFYYKWNNVNNNFIMPLDLLVNGEVVRVLPSPEYQSLKINKHSQIEIMDWKFYVEPVQMN